MANMRFEWVLLEPESDVIAEVLGAVDESITEHTRYTPPGNFKHRRNGNRLAIRIVQTTADIVIASGKNDDPDITDLQGLRYLGGYEAHKIRQGIDSTLMLIGPGKQLFIKPYEHG